MKKITGYLARAAVSVLTAVSIAAVSFPSVSVYAEDASVSQQETEIGIGALNPGEPRRGVNWYWDGNNTLSLYGVDMTGTGNETLFDYTGSGEIKVAVSGYNRIDNFYSMYSGVYDSMKSIAISGAGTLEAANMKNMWVWSNVTVSDVYIKASGSTLLNYSNLTLNSGYIYAPDMDSYCQQTLAKINISGGCFDSRLIYMKNAGAISVSGGFVYLSTIKLGIVYYQNCVIKLSSVSQNTPPSFRLQNDNAVLIVDRGSENVKQNEKTPKCENAIGDSAKVWCHNYIEDDTDTSKFTAEDYCGMYYSGSNDISFNNGAMSGGNYLSTTRVLTVKGFSDKTTLVGSSGSAFTVEANQADSTFIAKKGVLNITGDASGKNIGFIGTDGVKLQKYSAADNVVAISSSDDKHALECMDGVTLSGHITAHNSGNSVGLYLDSYGLTINGEVSAYSANSNAISFPFTVNEDVGFTLGENAEISACAPNAPENKVIIEDGGEVNGSTFGDKVIYAGKLSEQMRVRGTLKIPDKDYGRFGYDRVHIGSELFFDFDHGYDYRYASASEGIEAGYTANDLSIEYKGFNGSAIAELCLVSSREIDVDKIKVSVKNSTDTDITEDKFTIDYCYNAYDKDDMQREVSVNLYLKPNETLDVGGIYTVTAKYEGLTVEEEMTVTAYNTTLNFCLDQDYFNAHLNEQWYWETKFLGIDKISRGSTWEWYGTATEDYKAHTLVLKNFDLYTTGKTLVIPQDTTIILKGENKLRSDTAVIAVQSDDPGSVTIIGEEGSSIDLTAGKLSSGNLTSGAIDLNIFSTLYLRDCSMNITVLEPGGYPGDDVSGINVGTFISENSTLDVSAESEMYAGVSAFSNYTLIGSNSFSFINTDAALRGSSMEPKGRSVLVSEMENIIDVDLDNFNQKVKNGDYVEWLFAEDYRKTVTLKTQGITQKETEILLSGEDGEIVPGAEENITVDLNEYFEGGTGAYSIQLAPGAELPDWVVFDQAAGTLTVTDVPDEFIDPSTVDILVNDAVEVLRESENVKATVNIGAVVPKCTLTIVNDDIDHCLPHIDDQYYPNYPRGAEAHIKFKTDVENGWFVKTVTLNGVELTPDEDGMYIFKVEQDSELVVETEQRIRTLTLTTNGNGTIAPETAEYIDGSEVTLTVTPDEGYQVKSVTLNGTAVELTNGAYTFAITEDSVFAVEFEKIPAGNKILTVNCGEGGTVTPGTASYAEGTEVTLTVTPDEGYQVKSVTLNGTAVELTNGAYTFTITEDSVFAAEFEKIPAGNKILTVNCGEGGTVTPGTASYAEGSEVTLTVTPDEGYQVKSVTLNGALVQLINGKYTFTITENSTFEVTFRKKTSSGIGGGSSSGGGSARPSAPSAPASTETAPSVNGKGMSWSEAADRISGAAPGEGLVIDLNGSTSIPADVIKAISERGISVELTVDSVKSWMIDGAEISSGTGTADMTILPGNADKSALRGINGFDLKISGTNVPADIKLSFKKDYAGQFANVYKLNGGALEFKTSVRIGEDGRAVISGMDKTGEYVVMACGFSDLPGDVTNDGELNALDAAALLKIIVGLEAGENPLMADFNGDGEVNAFDAAAILKKVVGLN